MQNKCQIKNCNKQQEHSLLINSGFLLICDDCYEEKQQKGEFYGSDVNGRITK